MNRYVKLVSFSTREEYCVNQKRAGFPAYQRAFIFYFIILIVS